MCIISSGWGPRVILPLIDVDLEVGAVGKVLFQATDSLSQSREGTFLNWLKPGWM